MGNDLTNIGTIAIGSNTANGVFQINERLTWVKGRHQIKFGGSWNRYNMERYYSGNNGQLGFIQYNGAFSGVAFADFLLDQVQSKGRGSLTEPWTHLQNRVAFYAADDFKVTNALTLNLGLRWGYTSPLVEKDDRQANFDLSNAAPLLAGQNGNSRALYEPYYNGWEPRIGAAYRMGERWVFRGGYGITQYMEGTGANLRLPLNPPFFFESQSTYDQTSGASTISTGFEGLQALDRPSGVVRAWDPNLRPQFTQQWNLFAEYLIGSRSSINIGYVGNKSSHLVTPIEGNQPLPGHRRPEHLAAAPAAPSALRVQPGDHRHQHDRGARPVRLQRAADDVQAAAVERPGLRRQLHAEQAPSRTTSATTARPTSPPRARIRSTATTSRPTTGRRSSTRGTSSRSPAATSCRSARTGSIGNDWNRAIDAVAGGWSASFAVTRHTGYPITVQNSVRRSLQGTRSAEWPNLIGDPVADGPDARTLDQPRCLRHPRRWARSATPASASCARRATSTPTCRSASASRRSAASTCSSAARCSTSLNHPNFGPPNRDIQSTAFGTITTTAGDARVVQLVLKYYF